MRTLQRFTQCPMAPAPVQRTQHRPRFAPVWKHLVWCAGLLVLGCRADTSTVLLERDLRMQEDKIYHLQGWLDESEAARESTIRENDALKQELEEASKSGFPGTGPDTDLRAPSVDLPDADTPSYRDRPDLAPPTIDLPDPSDPPTVEMAPGEAEAIIVESPPTQLVINSRLTGGLDRDGHGGDEGILVVFEPRDAAGHLVRWPGKVSVVLMDPALGGEAARVARWNFSADEVPAHILSTVFGRGLQFELLWPGEPPRHEELVLFVRFTTEEGQRVTSDAKITIRPPDGNEPGFDRQTRRPRGRDAQPSDDRPEPRSRLKARAPSGDTPRAAREPAATDAAQTSFDRDSAADEESLAGKEPLLEAKRPEWKPFR
jgi:hypothetical protein